MWYFRYVDINATSLFPLTYAQNFINFVLDCAAPKMCQSASRTETVAVAPLTRCFCLVAKCQQGVTVK